MFSNVPGSVQNQGYTTNHAPHSYYPGNVPESVQNQGYTTNHAPHSYYPGHGPICWNNESRSVQPQVATTRSAHDATSQSNSANALNPPRPAVLTGSTTVASLHPQSHPFQPVVVDERRGSQQTDTSSPLEVEVPKNNRQAFYELLTEAPTKKTLEQAKDWVKWNYCSSLKQTTGTKTGKDGRKRYRFQCDGCLPCLPTESSVASDKPDNPTEKCKCLFRVRLDQTDAGEDSYNVMVPNGVHHHMSNVHTCEEDEAFPCGLPLGAKVVIDNILHDMCETYKGWFRGVGADRKKEILVGILKNTSEMILPLLYANRLTDPKHHRKVCDQINGYTQRKLAKMVAQSNKNMVTNADIDAHISDRSLPIPDEYEAQAEYGCIEEIEAKLGLSPMTAYFLQWDNATWNEFILLGKQRPTGKWDKEDISRALATILYTGARHLFNLQAFLMLPPGEHFIYLDGTHSVIHNGVKLIPLNARRVSAATGSPMASSEPITLCYVNAAEKMSCVVLALLTLKQYTRTLFGMDLVIDISASDRADAFVLSVPMVFGLVVSLQCYTHVLGQLEPSKGLYSKIKNKDLIPAYRSDLRMIHICSNKARDVASKVIMEKWALIDQEVVASVHFTKWYLTGRYKLWNFSATGIPGLYPSGNPDERDNLNLKGSKTHPGVVGTNNNVSMYLSQGIDKLIAYDTTRDDVPGIFPPSHPSHDNTAVACMMTSADINIPPTNNGTFYTNSYRNIGKVVTDERKMRYQKGQDGDLSYFIDILSSQRGLVPSQVDTKVRYDATLMMIRCGAGLCCITYNNARSCYIGNCELCYKYLQCPGVVLVLTKMDQLPARCTTLEQSILDFAPSRQRGRPQKDNLGGRNKGIQEKQVAEKNEAFYFQAFRKYYTARSNDALERLVASRLVRLNLPERLQYRDAGMSAGGAEESSLVTAVRWTAEDPNVGEKALGAESRQRRTAEEIVQNSISRAELVDTLAELAAKIPGRGRFDPSWSVVEAQTQTSSTNKRAMVRQRDRKPDSQIVPLNREDLTTRRGKSVLRKPTPKEKKK
jgi:hypothetical protein